MKTKDVSIAAYRPQDFESRWQDQWEQTGIYRTSDSSGPTKFYCLDYFPYPSGEGLHVGHCRNYVPTDLISRYKRMQGFNVLHPMGWDAFGEPAEQNAIRNHVTPRVTTDRNSANYKRQMQMIGTSYDWQREIDSSKPDYYRWTQWMFLKMYQKGLAYRDTNWQWWCPTCATTLSSHEIQGDKCWRGHTGVTKREIPAWYFKITAYADELITGLETVDWPEAILRMQTHWIGRSEGVMVKFGVQGEDFNGIWDDNVITTFTTRPDTLYGVTFIALAPEHLLVNRLIVAEQQQLVKDYQATAIRRSEIERTIIGEDKTGIFTGSYGIHPLTGETLPVFVADYVLPSVGTGAVMGVPAHDQRDYEFARKYDLKIKTVILGSSEDFPQEAAYEGHGTLVDSGIFDGTLSSDAGRLIAETLERCGRGVQTVNYRMRDWLISRQRYWGTPIPIVYCPNCGEVPLPVEDLPVVLPEMVDFTPDGSGRSPLGRVDEFVNTECPRCGSAAQRETDTMGGFACSSWYFLRFTSPDYKNGPFDPVKMKAWMPVDLYVGGAEHAVLHLLYARFWTKFLADEGLVPFREPFSKLINQGQLHGPDGLRMSKSRGNVIIPDTLVDSYGADALRLYCLFIAPFDQNVDWNPDGIIGTWRFLNRVWNLVLGHWVPDFTNKNVDDIRLERARNRIIKTITERVEGFQFNTMVSDLMTYVNQMSDWATEGRWKSSSYQKSLETLLVLMAPSAPYIAEELWYRTGHSGSIHQQEWPDWVEEMAQAEFIDLPIQVNGRRRATIQMAPGASEEEVLTRALELPEISKFISTQEITRIIYVPGKILSIVC